MEEGPQALEAAEMAAAQFDNGITAEIAANAEGEVASEASEAMSAAGQALNQRVAATFEGGEYEARVVQEDTLAFRAEGDQFGRYYGTVQPETAAHAEQLYNIAQYGNDMTEVSGYLIPKGATVFQGPVAGGTGTQIFVPDPLVAGVQLLWTKPLAQYGF